MSENYVRQLLKAGNIRIETDKVIFQNLVIRGLDTTDHDKLVRRLAKILTKRGY